MEAAVVRLTLGPFDPSAELASFRAGGRGEGALASFVGSVRGGSEGEAVTSLMLDHYQDFTERSLECIATDALRRFKVSRVLVVHRAGRMAPGEAIVLAAAAAAHRRPALEAVDYLMDMLKTDAAFWKREERASGSHWIEPASSDRLARGRWD